MLVGTVFENTNVVLRDWFRVIQMILTSKKGVAALHVQRIVSFGFYKTAHYMCHRIRADLVDPAFRQLISIVKIDETYIGPTKRRPALGRLASYEHADYRRLSDDFPHCFVRHGRGKKIACAVHPETVDGL